MKIKVVVERLERHPEDAFHAFGQYSEKCNFHKHVGLTKTKSINYCIDSDVNIPLQSICNVFETVL